MPVLLDRIGFLTDLSWAGCSYSAWQGIVVALFSLSVVGFVFDYSSHKDLNPLILLVVGGALLYLGRYVFGGAGFGGWQIWGPGAILVLIAVVYNKRQFSNKHNNHEQI